MTAELGHANGGRQLAHLGKRSTSEQKLANGESTSEQTAAAVAEVLMRAAASISEEQPFDDFDCVEPPGIALVDYAKMIAKLSRCSDGSCILSLAYIHKFLAERADFTLSVLNVHRLLLTSMAVAAKFFDDIHISNACYAKIGGTSTQELNMLEMKLLEVIGWKLHIEPESYDRFSAALLQHAACARVLRDISNDMTMVASAKKIGADIFFPSPWKEMTLHQRSKAAKRCRQSLSPSERRQRLRAQWFGIC